MPISAPEKPNRREVLQRTVAACAGFAVLSAIIVAILYFQDRDREWTLRCEQAEHRLDIAFELISREFDRVRADTMFLAEQQNVRRFAAGDVSRRTELEADFASFVSRKATYDQVRLLDLHGQETIRVNYAERHPRTVPSSQLQDKADRYYFRDALSLRQGEVKVSEFDLNLEYGQIERPLKPVIRFVTPVIGLDGQTKAFLVMNYLGATLLDELNDSSLPGMTLAIRPDGHYLRSPHPNDAWGWLLGHQRTFAAEFPDQWAAREQLESCQLTAAGAFAIRRVPLGQSGHAGSEPTVDGPVREAILLVSYLPRDQVFVASSDLLRRLLMLVGSIFIPLTILSRYWAQATLSRQIQARRIAQSEERMRELSSRLLRIHEDERRAISREVHDELGQQVTAIGLDLRLADRNLDSAAARPHLARAIHENSQLLQTLHAFASRVRPAVLDDLGLRDAVESHLWEFEERTHVEVESTLSFRSEEIPNEVADNAYRLLQESLNNVAKHAEASKVTVRMEISDDTQPRQFKVSICDDGRGYDENESTGSRLGLIGMRERVDLLSGELRISSGIAQGTRVEITLPLLQRTIEPTEPAL